MKYQMESTSETLLIEIREVDRGIYETHVPIDWYVKNYKNLSRIATARNEKGELKGYFVVTGIRSTLFEAIKDGTLSGDVSFTSNAFLKETDTNKYYASSIVVSPDVRTDSVAFRLLKMTMNHFRKNVVSDDFEMIAIVLSERVAKLTYFFGAKLIRRVDKVFIISFSKQ